jgi:hypothetical protein
MRLLRRRDDATPDPDELADEGLEVREEGRPVERREAVAEATGGERPEPVEGPEHVERAEGTETDLVKYRWSPGSALVVLAGAALAVLGIVALIRTEIDSTWYRPVEEVAGIDHTPLLAAIEVGVGVLLVVLGLAGRWILTALVCVLAAIAAAVAAVDPAEVQRELAIERWWAIALAVGAAVLAVASMMPRSAKTVERRQPAIGRRVYGRRHRTVQQH